MSVRANEIKYQAAAATNVVVSKRKAILERILIGKDVASAVLEVSDSADNGNGNVIIKITSSTMLADTGGIIEVGAIFRNGITADLTNQTDVTFIWSHTV